MRYDDVILRWAKIATILFTAMAVVADVFGVVITKYIAYCWAEVFDIRLVIALIVVFYLGTVGGYLVLIPLYKMLHNMSKDKVFDSNRWTDMTQQRKEMYKVYQPEMVGKDNPIEFALNQVIKGWTEGMKLIGKGGRIHLWIPAELAYGERGAGQDIAPNEALFFDVELLEVTSK